MCIYAGCISSSSCIFADWKAPDCNQLCRVSFIEYGWRIISNPLVKLLIEGVMSRGAPPHLTVTDARAAHKLKAECVAQIAVFVTSGSVAASVSSAHSDSGFPHAPLQSTLAAAGSSDVQETALGVASALLSAESEFWRHRKGTPNLYLITF